MTTLILNDTLNLNDPPNSMTTLILNDTLNPNDPPKLNDTLNSQWHP